MQSLGFISNIATINTKESLEVSVPLTFISNIATINTVFSNLNTHPLSVYI